MQQKYTHTQGI